MIFVLTPFNLDLKRRLSVEFTVGGADHHVIRRLRVHGLAQLVYQCLVELLVISLESALCKHFLQRRREAAGFEVLTLGDFLQGVCDVLTGTQRAFPAAVMVRVNDVDTDMQGDAVRDVHGNQFWPLPVFFCHIQYAQVANCHLRYQV